MSNTALHPRLVVIETSGRIGLVGLAEGRRLHCQRRLDEARRHARDLAPAVAELLGQQGWQPRQIDAAIVSRGPGSYTGLRVGIMSAKALARATGCALLGVDTFNVIARQAPGGVDRVVVIADAQQERVYAQQFERADPGESWQAPTTLRIMALEEFAGWCPKTAWLTGPGLHLHGRRLAGDFRLVDEALWGPQLEDLLGLGLARYECGERDDIYQLEPLYARPSAAEELWKAKRPPR